MQSKPTTAFATFDGAEAQAFIYERVKGQLSPLPGFPMSGAKKPEFSDKRGRVYQSASDRRSAAEPQSDPERALEREFVADVARRLEALRGDAFETLIVAAGPRALGYWRETAGPALQDVVKKELASDYSGVRPKDLVSIVEDAFLG